MATSNYTTLNASGLFKRANIRKGPAFVFVDGKPVGIDKEGGVGSLLMVALTYEAANAPYAGAAVSHDIVSAEKKVTFKIAEAPLVLIKHLHNYTSVVAENAAADGIELPETIPFGPMTARKIEILMPSGNGGWIIHRGKGAVSITGCDSAERGKAIGLDLEITYEINPNTLQIGKWYELDAVAANSVDPVPGSAAVDIAIDTTVQLTFEIPPAPQCLQTSLFKLTYLVGEVVTAVDCTIDYSYDASDADEEWTNFLVVIITPKADLENSEEHTWTVGKQVLLISGVYVATAETDTFTTVAA